MRTPLFHTLALLLAVILAAPSLRADEGEKREKRKPMQRPEFPGMGPAFQLKFLKEHADELKITAEQMKKIETLFGEYEKKLEKLKDDPNLKDLFMKLKEAHDAEDREDVREIQKQIRELSEKKSGISQKDAVQQLGKILTRTQMVNLEKVRRENGMGSPGPGMDRGEKGEKRGKDGKNSGGKEDPSRRPDPNKGAPKIDE